MATSYVLMPFSNWVFEEGLVTSETKGSLFDREKDDDLSVDETVELVLSSDSFQAKALNTKAHQSLRLFLDQEPEAEIQLFHHSTPETILSARCFVRFVQDQHDKFVSTVSINTEPMRRYQVPLCRAILFAIWKRWSELEGQNALINVSVADRCAKPVWRWGCTIAREYLVSDCKYWDWIDVYEEILEVPFPALPDLTGERFQSLVNWLERDKRGSQEHALWEGWSTWARIDPRDIRKTVMRAWVDWSRELVEAAPNPPDKYLPALEDDPADPS